ncbi:MAG TPA: glycosyltransferase family 4 protein [Gemmatimonadaceae bacterium]|nr:glycosyltransferase family 4 protein [Gemmatimonadaceae bacterium]
MTTFDVSANEALGPRIVEYRAPVVARPLRVVYLWDADYPWDVRTEKVCATLSSAGHDVHIVARNRAWRQLTERMPEGTVHRMPPWRLVGRRVDTALGFPLFCSPRWRGLLDRTVRDVQPDAIIVRDLPLAPTAVSIAHRRRVPVVLDLAENYPAMMRMIFEAHRQRPFDYIVRNPLAVGLVERYCLTRVDRVWVVIDEMAERLVRLGVPADRIDLVSNTPPRERAEAEPPSRVHRTAGPVDIVYLGLLEVPRGLGELIDAVALLRKEGVPVRTTIVGKGRDANLFHRQARNLGLGDDSVRFLGYVDRETAMAAVRDADIGILPHHMNEAWNTTIPNKLFDYMAEALPVLSSSVAPFARIVRETEAGEVFEAGNARSLADAIRRLSDSSRRAACGAAGRRAILERYHWERDTDVLLRGLELAARSVARNH